MMETRRVIITCFGRLDGREWEIAFVGDFVIFTEDRFGGRGSIYWMQAE